MFSAKLFKLLLLLLLQEKHAARWNVMTQEKYICYIKKMWNQTECHWRWEWSQQLNPHNEGNTNKGFWDKQDTQKTPVRTYCVYGNCDARMVPNIQEGASRNESKKNYTSHIHIILGRWMGKGTELGIQIDLRSARKKYQRSSVPVSDRSNMMLLYY